MLGSKATLATSLLIHELATNAVKYGALSAEGGRVAVSWRVEGPDADPSLTVAWNERGGPPVVQPTSRGFGSRLIGSGLVGRGGAHVDYRPEGLAAIFTSPMSQIDANL
jgi:two-component sensor histidine kinase